MKLSLIGEKARTLAKLLQFLSKIGPDLYLEALQDRLVLGCTNTSKSGFARIQLWPAFFMQYCVPDEDIESGDNGCRVALKACIPIFRSMKSVETCDIRMSVDKLIIQLHCRQNTTKTHFVSILEREVLSAQDRDGQTTINTLIASPKVFSDILSIFNTTEEELTIDAKKKGITVKNFIDSLHVNKQQLRTQLSLDPAEFDTYVVDTETNVTFCLKEWRAFLVLAESLNSNIVINFETTGLPIEFAVKDLDVYEVTLFMSTLSGDLDTSANDSVIVLGDKTQAPPVSKPAKRPAEKVDAELAALLKKPKPRAQRVSDQFSNPSIEDFTNNTNHGDSSSTADSNNRWTIARNAEEGNQLSVPVIPPNRVSTVSPRDREEANDIDIIFLKDTEEDDSDRMLSQIPMPMEDHRSMATIAETQVEEGEAEPMDTVVETEIPESPVHKRTQSRRRAALSVFRRCYEPSFRPDDVSGLNRILAESSDVEEE